MIFQDEYKHLPLTALYSTPRGGSVPVYNCTSGGINGITWGEVETRGLPIIRQNPYEGVFWYPGGTFKENSYHNRFWQV